MAVAKALRCGGRACVEASPLFAERAGKTPPKTRPSRRSLKNDHFSRLSRTRFYFWGRKTGCTCASLLEEIQNVPTLYPRQPALISYQSKIYMASTNQAAATASRSIFA